MVIGFIAAERDGRLAATCRLRWGGVRVRARVADGAADGSADGAADANPIRIVHCPKMLESSWLLRMDVGEVRTTSP